MSESGCSYSPPPVQRVSLVRGGPGFGTIFFGVTFGVCAGMWLFVISGWLLAAGVFAGAFAAAAAAADRDRNPPAQTYPLDEPSSEGAR